LWWPLHCEAGFCIITCAFNLYSEFLIREAMEDVDGIRFNGINITDLRYADDAVLVVYGRNKLQKMIDKLNETCKAYGMENNVKKTKVMVMNGTDTPNAVQWYVMLDEVPLERVTRFKYLGSWITDDGRSDEDI
jgi:hypothetical protein